MASLPLPLPSYQHVERMPSIHRLAVRTIFMVLLQASRRALAPAAFSTTPSSLAFSTGFSSAFASREFASQKIRGRNEARRQRIPFSSRKTLPLAVSLANPPSATNQTNGFSTMATLDGEDATATIEYPTEMSEAERYLFDLNGFLIVRNVLTPAEVAAAHAAIDAHADEAVSRSDAPLRNAVQGSPMYGAGPPRLDLGGIFEWGEIESRVFKSILAHPRLVPLFHGLLGKGYRLDHIPFVLMNNEGGEGFQLHGGTVDCTSGEYNSNLAYACHHGSIRSNLLGCNVMLVDHEPGDGGFCVVPGSHKSNFRMPPGMVDGLAHAEYIVQPATKAGDVVLFSEGTVHGAMGWKSKTQRRCALYRFAPATMSYGRSYFRGDAGEGSAATAWPAQFYEGLDDAQRAVLEPPYANRLDRPNIREDGSVEVTRRGGRKKQHDRDVFKTKYF